MQFEYLLSFCVAFLAGTFPASFLVVHEICNSTLSCDQDILAQQVSVIAYQGIIPNITISSTNLSVHCYSAYGCHQAQSITSKTSINCTADNSCSYIPINYDDSVAHGSSDFDNSITITGNANSSGLSANDEIRCAGTNSCSNSLFNSKITALCSGEHSCANTIAIDSASVNGYGPYSLRNSILYNVSIIGFWGYFAGINATIECDGIENNNSSNLTACTVICVGSGCANVNFNCNASQCSVICFYTEFFDFEEGVFVDYCPQIDENGVIESVYVDVDNDDNILMIDTLEWSELFDYTCSLESNSNTTFDNYFETILDDGSADSIVLDNQGHNICCRGAQACGRNNGLAVTSADR